MTKKTYKILLGISVLLCLLLLIDLTFQVSMPEYFIRAKQQYGDSTLGYLYPLSEWLGSLSMALLAVAVIGLGLFKKWAPRFALLVTVFSFVPYFLYHAHVHSPLSMFILGLMDLVWGAVLVIAFIDPYKKWFIKN